MGALASVLKLEDSIVLLGRWLFIVMLLGAEQASNGPCDRPQSGASWSTRGRLSPNELLGSRRCQRGELRDAVRGLGRRKGVE